MKMPAKSLLAAALLSLAHAAWAHPGHVDAHGGHIGLDGHYHLHSPLQLFCWGLFIMALIVGAMALATREWVRQNQEP